MKDLSDREKHALWEKLLHSARVNGPSPDDFPSVARRLTEQHQLILLISNHLARGLELQKQGSDENKKQEAELWQKLERWASLNGAPPKDYPSAKLRFIQLYQSILLIENNLRLQLEFRPQTQSPAEKVQKVNPEEIQVIGKIQKIEKIFNHPLTTVAISLAAVVAAGCMFFDYFERPTSRQEHEREIRQAILDAKNELSEEEFQQLAQDLKYRKSNNRNL